MEKRIGSVLILINEKDSINKLNHIISDHADIILGRQGLPLRDKQINVISLVLEGTTDQMSALTGKLGRLSGVQVKSIVARV
ncbi:MAG: TM1266 family iron-only hydrogenase system putative regulator [Bacteroidota bacterium]